MILRLRSSDWFGENNLWPNRKMYVCMDRKSYAPVNDFVRLKIMASEWNDEILEFYSIYLFLCVIMFSILQCVPNKGMIWHFAIDLSEVIKFLTLIFEHLIKRNSFSLLDNTLSFLSNVHIDSVRNYFIKDRALYNSYKFLRYFLIIFDTERNYFYTIIIVIL